MAKKNALSEMQLIMLGRLRKGRIRWADTLSAETQSINSLVKRGLVAVHKLKPDGDYSRDSYWTLK